MNLYIVLKNLFVKLYRHYFPDPDFKGALPAVATGDEI